MKLLLVDFTAVFSILPTRCINRYQETILSTCLNFKTAKCGRGWENDSHMLNIFHFFALAKTLKAPNGIVQCLLVTKIHQHCSSETEIGQPDRVLKGKTFIWTANHSCNSIWWRYYAASFMYSSKEASSFTKLAFSRVTDSWGKWKTGQGREKTMRNCLSFCPTQLFETWNRLLPSIIDLYN